MEFNQSLNKEWYGIKKDFTKQINHFYKDNSLEKPVKLRSISDRQKKLLREKIVNTHQKLKVIRNQLSVREEKELRVKQVQQEILDMQAKQLLMNEKAVFIQKHVRGFLARKNYELEIIQTIRGVNQYFLGDLEEVAEHCLLNVGKAPETAAICIQRFVKKYLFLKKVRRLQHVYDQIQREKVEKTYRVIRLGIYKLRADLCKQHLMEEKEKFEKLEQIKFRLAILKVKMLLKASGVRVRLIARRLKKYKQIQKFGEKKKPVKAKTKKSLESKPSEPTPESLEVSEVTATDFGFGSPELKEQLLDPEEDSESFYDSEYEEKLMIQEMLEKKKQQRLKKCMVSYNIRQEKEQDTLPFLFSKPENEKTFNKYTACHASRVTESKAVRTSPQRSRDSKISPITAGTPRKAFRIKFNLRNSTSPQYMMPTASSSRSRPEHTHAKVPKVIPKIKPQSKLMSPTNAFSAKVAHRRSESTKQPRLPNILSTR